MAPYENSLWYIETNVHPLLEKTSGHKGPEMVNYIRPSFWKRFVELQQVMWTTNAGLTERHAYDSRPLTWPVLRRGINFWTKDHRQVYLVGNPLIWWGSLCALMVYAGFRALLMLRTKRGYRDYHDSMVVFYDQTAGFLALGWAMHFFPFFLMNRQLFVHHYLPALYFAILLTAVLFDLLTSGLRPKYRFIAASILVAIAALSYSTYAPLTYGEPWTAASCERARLLKSWDFNCREFPDSLGDYRRFGPGIHSVVPPKPTGANLPVPDLGAKQKIGHAAGGADHDPAAPVGGDDSATTYILAEQAVAAQAGNHPFEKQPDKAHQSGSAAQEYEQEQEQEEQRPPVFQEEDNGELAAAARVGGGDKVVDAAPPVPQQPAVAGHGGEGDNRASSATQANIAGMDAEGVEQVVLEGTAKVEPNAVPNPQAANVPSHAATDETANTQVV